MKKSSTLRWLLQVTGKTKWLVGILIILQAVLSVLSIMFAFALRCIINMAVAGVQKAFWIAIVFMIGILLLQTILAAANRLINEYTKTVVENRFKQKLFSTLLTGKYASVTAVHSGEWMNRLTSDTMVVAEGITQIVPGIISMLVRLIGGNYLAGTTLFLYPGTWWNYYDFTDIWISENFKTFA